MMAGLDLSFAFNLPPEKALEYFRGKGYAITGDWREMDALAHQKAFTVAHMAKLDILQDIRNEVDKYIAGGSMRDAHKNLQTILEAKGWWGKGWVFDADGVGIGKKINARRINTILRQNKLVAFAAARHDKLMASVETRPWWRYNTRLDNRVRPGFRGLHGLLFRHDDAFWDAFYPPNGWFCRCFVTSHSERDLAREGWQDERRDSAADDSLNEWEKRTPKIGGESRDRVTTYTDPRRLDKDGKIVKVTPDVGWSTNPAKDWARPFTPPPLDDLPRTFKGLGDVPPLPRPTKVSAADVLPKGLSEQDYARAFLSEFGATLDDGVVFKDVVGAPLQVNKQLFVVKGTGELKADKQGRGQYLKLLAQVIKNPDEIWLGWQDQGGVFVLKRRYIKVYGFETDGRLLFGLGVFEYGQDGWTGNTVFPPKDRASKGAQFEYINKQRDGLLIYRVGNKKASR